MRSVLLFLALVVSATAGPWEMAELAAPPKVEWGAKDGLTQEAWYEGESFAGKPTRIFSYVGRPEGKGPFPAVVLVHGGGGQAFRDWALHWAGRGYVAIAMDTAGRGPGKSANPAGGPDQGDATKFRTDLPAREMWTYHAVAAAIRGHSLLLSLPEVDKARTALTGISWGGYLTCIIAGVDHRFKAVVPVYGCGYLHQNSAWLDRLERMTPEARGQWVKLWDPSSYLADVRCPILFFDGTNDFAYPLDSLRKCIDLVRPELRHVSIVVGLKHGHYWDFPEPDGFIDAVINGGDPIAKLGPMEVNGKTARASITNGVTPAKAELHFTADQGTWQKRKWTTAYADLGKGGITAELPDARPLTFYLSVTDSRGIRTSTTHAELPEEPEGASQEERSRAARLRWFHEAKYGLFINWGLYSIPAGEWKGKPVAGIGEWIMHNARIPVKEYELLAKQFNPSRFNADEWAQLAADAGMKYVVFDCKHHDGFALYHSKVNPYNCYDATPWKRDPFKELQTACAKRGLKLCFYYSQATDWHEPNGANNDWDYPPNAEKDFDQYLRDKSFPQVRELLTNYGPISLIWFDVPTLMTPERSKRLSDLVHSIQPDTLINSRLGPGGHHDYQSRGDNEIPHQLTPGAWETAATVNDTWGYKQDDHHWKSPEDITFKLVDIVSKGGNYLLNVGPDGDGFIPQPSQDILREVGAWLEVHGEAIYGAGRTPFGEELGAYVPGRKDRRGRPVFAARKDWRCTTKPGKLYIHLFTWPGEEFQLGGVNDKVTKAYLLTSREPLPFTQTDGKVTIDLPVQAPDAIAAVLCLETQGR